MLLEIYIFFEIVTICLFLGAFFTKQELLWAITALISGVLMVSSFNIQTFVYKFNVTLGAYQSVLISNSYPYLMGINMLFFSLALLLGLFDVFDKYGTNLLKKGNEGL